MANQPPRPFLLAGRSLVANHAGQPEASSQFDPCLSQGGCGVNHGDQAAFHVLRASSVDPVAIAERTMAVPDRNGVDMTVEQQRTPSILHTGHMRIHVPPSRLNLVKSRVETFAPKQIGKEDAS